MHQLARLGVIFSLKRYRLLPKKIRRIYINNWIKSHYLDKDNWI